MDEKQFKILLDKIEELIQIEKKNNAQIEDMLNLFKQYDGEVILGDEEFRGIQEG
jgi:septation ring formation regulator EzrA